MNSVSLNLSVYVLHIYLLYFFNNIIDPQHYKNYSLWRHVSENGVVRRKTYRELNNLANKLAKVIRKTVMQNGLYTEKDENFIIGVHMLPSDYFVITVLAILKVGAGYLPLDPNYPSDRIEYIVSDSKLAMVIYNKGKSNTSSVSLNYFWICH